ncbi:MAG: hypothetical protein ACXVYM_06235 [Gaiellaceae bacterium]
MAPASRPRPQQRVLHAVDSGGLPLLLLAFYGAILAGFAPLELVQDSWLTLVGGREVAAHGIPHHETLTVLAHGVHWVDQQWLAQLFFYEVVRLGGLRLAVLLHVLLLVSAFALALAAARRRGASANAVFWVGLVCVFLAPWGWQLRAQSFAFPLFAGTLWLLIADSRAPSRRVLAVLPLLALWGNLHGSVILGAALVALRGITIFWERSGPNWVARATLLCAAPLAALASPYGAGLVGYYHHMLGSPLLSTFVQEWGPTTPQKAWLFYAVALAALWLLGRAGSALTLFERLALLASIVAALTAIRQVVWFELTAAALLPVLVTAWRGKPAEAAAPRWVGRFAAVGLVVTAVALLSARTSWFESRLPTGAQAAIVRTTGDPGTRVFASESLADWLLWADPKLDGRVAYDVRFEILTRRQLQALVDYHHRAGRDWAGPTKGYRVLVLDRRSDGAVAAALRRRGLHVAYADRDALVLTR